MYLDGASYYRIVLWNAQYPADISVTIFPPLTVVKSDESTASITCTPSYPRLPIVWTGREQLQELSNETVLVVDNPVDGQAFTCQLVNGTAAVSTLVRVIPGELYW